MAEPIASDLLPEDAYDGGDSFFERLRVIERAVESWLVDSDNESQRIRREPIIHALEKLTADRDAKPFLALLADLREQMEGN